MITVNVTQLVKAIREADAFRLPDMTAGADYIYNKLYKRLAHGEDVRLSQIDFDAFELDDVDSMRELYSDVLEANECKAESITRSLQGLSATVAVPVFV